MRVASARVAHMPPARPARHRRLPGEQRHRQNWHVEHKLLAREDSSGGGSGGPERAIAAEEVDGDDDPEHAERVGKMAQETQQLATEASGGNAHPARYTHLDSHLANE